MSRHASIVVLAVGVLGAFGHAAHAQVRYTLTDLGVLGGTSSGAEAINNAGDVVGSSTTADGPVHAFLYRNGVMMDLGVPPGMSSEAASGAVGINNAGQIIVESTDSLPRSFLYSNGQYTDLGGLGGPVTRAAAINDAGQIVGHAVTAANETHAFLYSGGSLQDLGTLGSLAARPTDINNAGVIVGALDQRNSSTGMPEVHGFLLENGVVRDFGADAGPGTINDLGHYIGCIAGVGNALVRDGQTIPLGGGVPLALNNADEIVGQAELVGSLRAIFYENGGFTDLNTLIVPGSGLRLSQAFDINDRGQIVGAAITAAGDTHAFLLTPVPEPTGLAGPLLGVALLRRCRTL